MLKYILFFVLFCPTLAEAEKACDRVIANPTISDLLPRFRVYSDGFEYTPEELKRFWAETWPDLRQMAKDSDISLSQLFDSYFDDMEFVIQAFHEIDHPEKSGKLFEREHRDFKTALALLESRGNNAKLKRNHWAALHVVAEGIFSLMSHLVTFQAKQKGVDQIALVNPFAAITTTQLRNLFDGLDDITDDQLLDHTIALSDAYKDLHQRLENGPERPPPSPVATPTVIPAAPPALPTTELDLTNSADLNAVLRFRLPLTAGKTYDARSREREFKVTIDPRIVREDQGGDNDAVRRLLKGIIRNNERNGIKMLTDIGPKIVELKAVMRGHKRIIGCLEGSALTLKYLINIKDSRQAYQARINPNECL